MQNTAPTNQSRSRGTKILIEVIYMAHAGTHGASENNSDRPKLLYGLTEEKEATLAEVMEDTARAD